VATRSLHDALPVSVLARALGGQQDAGQTVVGRSHDATLRRTGGAENGKSRLTELGGNGPHPFTGHALGLDVTVNDEDRKIQLVVHGPTLSTALPTGSYRRARAASEE